MPNGGLAPGLYERLITLELDELLGALSGLVDVGDVDRPDVPVRLADHARRVLERALQSPPLSGDPAAQVALVNQVVRLASAAGADRDIVSIGPRLLRAVLRADASGLARPSSFRRPTIPLSDDSLLVNAPGDPSLSTELRHEIASADRIDLICAFVVWTGLRVMLDDLRAARERGVPIRVITTTYTGTTDARALNALRDIGADVRVSYELGATRLHAKAWLFRRNSEFGTAYVGSSNLTHTALHEGIEWNVRLTEHTSPALLSRFDAAFETYWASDQFEPYDPAKFAQAIAAARSSDGHVSFAFLDVRPLDFQARMLERLRVERERFDRHRNLVVAATGTGKTVMAALDFQRLQETLPRSRLLFVAHRQEILDQARNTFRQVQKDGSFGELMVAGKVPTAGTHVFASIQSLNSRNIAGIAPDFYDCVIVDEFHHAAAPTYAAVLGHLRPRELLGLTATPERADEQDILRYFDGRIAAELRLWEAIDYGYLCPFQYFGIADGTDVSAVRFTRGRYDLDGLSSAYTGNDERVRIVLAALERLVGDPLQMRAFGFCVSVDHARFMADRFARAGIPSTVVVGTTPETERAAALVDLRDRRVNCVFSVDVFNEGVDVPQIDTVLMLRPTESATIFLQQLGRGLRRAAGKTGLTVLDFIGRQNEAFTFAPKLAALTGRASFQLRADVEQDFPFVPSGCHVELDRVSRESVLENLARQVRNRRSQMVDDLRAVGDASLPAFLSETARTLDDIYRAGGWMSLRRDAGLGAPAARPGDEPFIGGVNRLRHADDPERISKYRAWAERSGALRADELSVRDRRLLEMLLRSLVPAEHRRGFEGAASELWSRRAVLAELLAMLDVIEADALDYPRESVLGPDMPLVLHGRYTRAEALIALGDGSVSSPAMREGVRPIPHLRTDAFFVTLDKSGAGFSPTTRYRDYPISPREFHWESQSTTGLASPTGRRYVAEDGDAWTFLLFVRERPELAARRTAPFLFLGRVRHERHESERPIRVTWRLDHPMPIEFFEAAKTVA